MSATIWHIIFWGSLGALVHSYVLYPLLMRWLASRRPPLEFPLPKPPLFRVSVLMAVYNEEAVIEEKIASLQALHYPTDQIRFFIGSDCSDDGTNTALARVTRNDERFVFFPFPERRGKPAIINDLAKAAGDLYTTSENHLFIITDANVLLEPDLVQQLAAPFTDSSIGLVDSHIINTGLRVSGISRSENQYINKEVGIKTWESQAWRAMMGPFGGCYALRSDCFRPIPTHFLVDDFYLAMCVFERGLGAVNNLQARCYEAIPHQVGIEFRRKARIAAGNWQNLTAFWRLWFPPLRAGQTGQVAFAFFSHKILRWWGPFFLLAMLTSAAVLSWRQTFAYPWLLGILLTVLFVPPVLDGLLRKLNIHLLPLRSLSYFFYMNLALLKGFFRFLGGIRSGVWNRTQRQIT